MFLLRKKDAGRIMAPAVGRIKPLSQVEDPVFSAGTMGPGFAVEPEKGEITAPVSGTVSTLFPGGHALGITGDDGVEVLVHIGVDTVKRKGDGFKVHTSESSRVKAGDLLVTADVKKLRAAGYICDVICVMTSSGKHKIDESLYGTYARDEKTPVMSYKK